MWRANVNRFLGVLACVGLICSGGLAPAQAPAVGAAQGNASVLAQPALVVAFSGFDSLKSDVAMLGELTNNPDLLASFEGSIALFTHQQGLAGLDTGRPWGALGTFTGTEAQAVAFVPVTDLSHLLDALEGLVGTPEDVGDGIQLVTFRGVELFVKQQGNWAFVAQARESLVGLPADPSALLSGLHQEYDLAIRLNVQNIPQNLRDQAIDQIRNVARLATVRQSGQTEEDFRQQQQNVEMQLAALSMVLEQVDHVTVGLLLDGKTRRLVIDLGVELTEAVAQLAGNLGAATAPASAVAGAGLPGALASLHVNLSNGGNAQELAGVAAQLQTLRTEWLEGIERDAQIQDPRLKTLLKQLVSDLTDEMQATAAKGQLALAASVNGQTPVTVLAGVQVADGARLEAAIKRFVQEGKEIQGFPPVRLDAAEYNGVRFHTLSLPTAEVLPNNAPAKQLLGPTFDVTLAFGPQSAYLAVGANGLDHIKKAVDLSANAEATASLPPFKASISLGQLASLLSRQPNSNPMLAMMALQLGNAGQDHLHLSLVPHGRGVRYRLEAEEGLLRVLAGWAGIFAAQRGTQ